MSDLIKKIVEVRKLKGLTQDELAKKIQVDRRYIVSIERGSKTMEALIKVLEELGIKVVYVENGKVPLLLDKGVWNDVKVMVGKKEEGTTVVIKPTGAMKKKLEKAREIAKSNPTPKKNKWF